MGAVNRLSEICRRVSLVVESSTTYNRRDATFSRISREFSQRIVLVLGNQSVQKCNIKLLWPATWPKVVIIWRITKIISGSTMNNWSRRCWRMMNSTERSSCANTSIRIAKQHAEMPEISMMSVIYSVVNSSRDPSLLRQARLASLSRDKPRAGHSIKQSHRVWAKRSRYIQSIQESERRAACYSRRTIPTWPPCIHLRPIGRTKVERPEAWPAEKSWRFKT